MSKDKSAKGQKIGRHSRAPSNKMQERRTLANKARHRKANPGSDQGVPTFGRPYPDEDAPTRVSRIPAMANLVEVKAARIAAQRVAKLSDVNAMFRLTLDPVAALKLSNPKASMREWKLAAEKQMRMLRAAKLRPVDPNQLQRFAA